MNQGLPVVNAEQLDSGLNVLAQAYTDCTRQHESLYEVDPHTASLVVEKECGPLRKRLQEALNALVHRLEGVPASGPVVVRLPAQTLLAVVRNGLLRVI